LVKYFILSIKLDSKLKRIKERDKNEKKLTDNKKIYYFKYIMIVIYIGIICFIYIKNEVGDKEQSNQIKNETNIKIINLENKINLLENKLYNLSAKFNEQINNNSNKTKIELSEISFEKFDENIFQQIKNQQMEFCNNQSIYFNSSKYTFLKFL
jgi:hypothetical protein